MDLISLIVEQLDSDEQQPQFDSMQPLPCSALSADRHCRRYLRPIKKAQNPTIIQIVIVCHIISL